MATMNSLTDIWSVVMDSLSQELTQTAINTWFSDCTPIEINNNTLIVHTTSDFKRSIIQSRFEKTICAVLYDLFSCPFELIVLAGDDELLEYREKRPSSEEMPEMDGHRLTKLIKEDERLKKLPVVIFSSLVNEQMRQKGKELGADEQLSKPEIGHLVAVMDELLARFNRERNAGGMNE